MEIISKQRKTLMGLAAIMILIAHIDMPEYMLFLQRILGSGVEIFLLLAGMSSYYSLSKNSIMKYYKNRMIRIFPVYWVSIIFEHYIAAHKIGVPDMQFLEHSSAFVSLFKYGEITGWFIVAITFFYLLAPVFYWLINKYKAQYIIAIFAVAVIVAQIEFYAHGSFYMVNNFVFSRMPAFMIGMLIGASAKNKDFSISLGDAVLFEVISFALLVWNFYFNTINDGLIMKLLNVPFALFTCIILANIITNKYICYILSFFGGISLECYLFFEKFQNLFKMTAGSYYVFYAFLATTLTAVGINFIYEAIDKAKTILKSVRTQ